MSLAGGTFPYHTYDGLGGGAMMPQWDRDGWGDHREFWPREIGMGACPGSSPTVVVEATQIPEIVWWIAGAWALWMAIKRS